MGRLTATAVKAANEPGRYGDGDGLFLLVGKRSSKSWMVRVQKDGRRRDIGLGSASKVSVALARERARSVRSQIEAGLDPVTERRKSAGIPTFREAAAAVHAEHKDGWKNAKHQKQWLTTLENYAFPAFGDMAVCDVDAPTVRDALAAIWLSKPETARRLRQRIINVLDWALAKGYREAPLAIAVIDKALPKQRAKPKHHPALPYSELPTFMAGLRSHESMGRFALEMLILTTVRSGDVRGMKWSEIDLDKAEWSLPLEEDGRNKSGRVHVVPLSNQALDLLGRMKAYRRGDSDLVFPGTKRGATLSDMTLTKAVRDMHQASVRSGGNGYLDPIQDKVAVPHGFRSTFRDWVSEQTSWPSDVAEAALAHVVSDKTVAAYQRGPMLQKRAKLMASWANYCDGADSGKLIRLAM